jgi:cytochrome c biogenesis factor
MPGLAQDLYVNFEWMGSGTILLHARVLPAVSGVWAGAILVILGLVSSVDLRRTHRNEISG